MKPKSLYVELPREAAEHNQRYITKLHYDYKRVTKDPSYNTCQIGNSVLGHQDWPRYSFPRSTRVGAKGALIGICLIAIAVFVAVFEYGLLDQFYIDLFLK